MMAGEHLNNYEIIENSSQLEKITDILNHEKRIAVDLEADSMFHYREKVCLIQVATGTLNVLIDPLKVEDVSPLKPVFSNPEIKKIFHGADYDIRSLHRDFNIEINALFDTEIASRFLGAKETGLDAVLKQRFNIDLDKKFQKKDWSQRPLPDEMLEYAASDSVYLLPLAELLEKELELKGRLSWVNEECGILSNVRQPTFNGEPLFLRFKGAGRLDSRSLGVLESLLKFRQQVAEKKDKPLFKVIGNTALLKIAQAKPWDLKLLKKLKVLSEKQIAMYGAEIVDLVEAALNLPENEVPVYPRNHTQPKRKPAVPKRLKALKTWRDLKAEALGIDPSLIFTKTILNQIAIDNPTDIKKLETVAGIKKWQLKEFGQDIVTILSNMTRRKQRGL